MRKSSGFTIIETTLVLAIAGLIIVMAFIALPSLWISQRDSDRRANVMAFISALKTYQTNNSRGALPTGGGTYTTQKPVVGYAANNWGGLIQDYYLKSNSLEDPSGTVYKVQIGTCSASSTGDRCTIGDNNFDNNVNVTNTPNFSASDPTIYAITGGTCDESGNVVKTNSSRSVAAVQVLERGKYCQNT